MSGEGDQSASDAPERLDRQSLPDRFSLKFISGLHFDDLEWLETEAKLTPLQLASFQSSMSTLGAKRVAAQAVRDRIAQIGLNIAAQLTPQIPKFDPIGEELRKSVADLRETITAHRIETSDPIGITDSVRIEINGEDIAIETPVERHAEHMAALARQQETYDQVAAMLTELVNRTEQQHRAAEAQKDTNFFLALIAGASMIGTMATVEGATRIVFAVAGTVLLGCVLYILHRSVE